jgi:hypothetical protein
VNASPKPDPATLAMRLDEARMGIVLAPSLPVDIT